MKEGSHVSPSITSTCLPSENARASIFPRFFSRLRKTARDSIENAALDGRIVKARSSTSFFSKKVALGRTLVCLLLKRILSGGNRSSVYKRPDIVLDRRIRTSSMRKGNFFYTLPTQ